MSFAARERQELVDTFVQLGPQAPTLCEGWTADHLAAHLLIRERSPLAAAGMFIPALAGLTERAMQRQLERPFMDVVKQWGRGPVGVWRLLDGRANVAEHFIHHEDLRRANGLMSRRLSTADQRELYAALRTLKLMYRASSCRVELCPTGFVPISTGSVSAEDKVQIRGAVGELLLYTYQRPAEGLDFVGDATKVVRSSL
ncbi:TIGR03085 family metal-binding protein [Corynebacterium sp. H127]|uniref:TIGR03085 family metal-binding protein n=1 Tax=Corynebacterium sp. H127 TaxID=3133418 RepID=UPI0030A5B749